MLEAIIEDALRQAEQLFELDAPRAEAWASDLLALAAETGADGPRRLVGALADADTVSAGAALRAIGALAPSLTAGTDPTDPAPPWAAALGTAECEGAWLLRAHHATSAALRFVDRDDARHVIVVDLVPGPAEQVGEVAVGPAELLDALEEADARVEVTDATPSVVASRIGAALHATRRPTASAVANGRLLVARLALLGEHGLEPPVPAADEVPDLAPRDPDDDAYALGLLSRALGEVEPPDEADVAAAAATLRGAAASEAPLARWLAASVGPVDLDDPDLDVVLAAAAATIAPARLSPLAPDERDAVLVLEWADWLGVVLGLVREGQSASVDPEELVDLINRCPEVTTTVPRADRDRVCWALGICTAPWAELGVATGGRLTPFGAAILPRVLARAWG